MKIILNLYKDYRASMCCQFSCLYFVIINRVCVQYILTTILKNGFRRSSRIPLKKIIPIGGAAEEIGGLAV